MHSLATDGPIRSRTTFGESQSVVELWRDACTIAHHGRDADPTHATKVEARPSQCGTDSTVGAGPYPRTGHLAHRCLPSVDQIDAAWPAFDCADGASSGLSRAEARPLLGSWRQGARSRSGRDVRGHRDQARRFQQGLHGQGPGRAAVEREVPARGADRGRFLAHPVGGRLSPAAGLLPRPMDGA